MTPFRTTRRVEFGDTDMAGIVHFSNYLRYMEAAETAFLRARGMSVSWHEDGLRVGFPRVSVACDFTKPAHFGDVLTIAVALEKVGTKSLSYRFDFSRGDDAIAIGKLTSVYCREAPGHGLCSIEIPDALRAKLLSEAVTADE